MNYSLSEFAALCGGTLAPNSDGARRVDYIESDTRLIKGKSTLFAAFKGDHFDGHTFVADLCKNGGAIIDSPEFVCPNAIVTDSVKAALYRIAQHHRATETTKAKVLAVTGSVGKTTAKNMAYLVMSSYFDTYKSKGNRNSLTGLPMEVLNMPEHCTHAVLEAGMSLPGELEQISSLILPEAAIITTVGHSHIEAFGSREAICEEKLAILSSMQKKNLVAMAEPLLLAHKAELPDAVFCSVTDKSADAYAENIKTENGKTRFTVCFGGTRTECLLPALGEHNVANALLCVVAGIRLGVPEERAAGALEAFVSEGMRQNIHVTNGINVIADCYNASPESMKAALGVLAESAGTRYAVLGDMLELGSHSEKLHRMVGDAAADKTDVLFCVGSEAKYIAKAALEGGFDEEKLFLYESADYEKAAEHLLSLVKQGDTVLFKASNRTCVRKILEKTEL